MMLFSFDWRGCWASIERAKEDEVRAILRDRFWDDAEIEVTIEDMKAHGICSPDGLEYLP